MTKRTYGSSHTWVCSLRDVSRHFSPVLFALRCRLDYLWRYNKSFLDYNETCIVVILLSVVSAWTDCNKLSLCKTIKSIHTSLMRTQNHAEIVCFKEFIYSVCSKFHNVILSKWVSHSVWTIALFIFAFTRITP